MKINRSLIQGLKRKQILIIITKYTLLPHFSNQRLVLNNYNNNNNNNHINYLVLQERIDMRITDSLNEN